MKHMVIALNLATGPEDILGRKIIQLPEGCVGFCLAFESKKAAKEFWSKDVELIRVEFKDDSNPRES